MEQASPPQQCESAFSVRRSRYWNMLVLRRQQKPQGFHHNHTTTSQGSHISPSSSQSSHSNKSARSFLSTMRRVSSRQRLVSWDEADPNFFAADQLSDPEDSYDDEIAVPSKAALLFAAMTKKRKRRIVHVIPPDEQQQKEQHYLPNDLWCHVHSFLDKPSLQAVLCTSISQRRMVLQHTALWTRLIQQQWGWTLTNNTRIELGFSHHLTRLPWSPIGPQRLELMGHNPSEWKVSNNTYQYTGSTVGDRCLRADAPLHNRRGPVLRPMVVQNEKDDSTTSSSIWIQPTLCSYFEITIESNTTNDTTATECIAIGLATAQFGIHGRQPGWDPQSYGWHGDDGGLFHGKGSMQQPLETFGPGDTVGCGILLHSAASHKRRICFTKNGRLLGTPFTLKSSSSKQQWYPVVGIDAPHAITCNFGATPFQWDSSKR